MKQLHYQKPMLWVILGIILACIVVTVLFLANPFTPKGDDLLRVLNSKDPFIKESGETVKLQTYIQNTTAATASAPDRYTLLDLDGDGKQELVAHIAYGEGTYLVFHLDGKKVYGFSFAERDFQNLKADGTFLKSNSAYVNYYYAISFSGAEYQLTELAYGNHEKSKARIDGKEVTTAEFSDYTVAFWNKPAAEWVSCAEPVDPMPLYREFLANKSTAKDSWQEKTLASYLPAHGYHGYAFLDMSGDGVPELCVKEYNLHFFTVKNGELCHWYTEENGYCKLLKNGALYTDINDGGDYGVQSHTYKVLSECADVPVRVTFEQWDGRFMDSSQVHPDRYVFNGQDVTKAEYEEKAAPYLDLSTKEIPWQGAPEEPTDSQPPENVPPVNPENYDTLLLSVLENATAFVDEAGKSVYLKDYKLGAKEGVIQDIAAVPETYTLVDMDGDGTKELVVYVTPSYGAYLVFRVYEDLIYGYEFGVRSMVGLQKDGSFTQSGGADLCYYVSLYFEGNACKVYEQAYRNGVDGVYRIGGKYATAEQIFDFEQDFFYREVAIWENWKDRSHTDSKTLYEAFLNGEKTAALETGEEKTVYGYLGNAIKNGYSYTYFDMTGDGEPELCIKALPFMYFFTIENGKIQHWYSGYMMYYRLLNNGALLYERHDGVPSYSRYEYYTAENGTWTLQISFGWSDGFTFENMVYDEEYVINGKKVSQEEYEKTTTPYLEIGDERIVWFHRSGDSQ